MTAARVSKDLYYLGIAGEVARRSTCFRRSIGAIIVRDDQIVSTGYVGAPRKTRDSLDHGFCLRDRLGIPHGQRYELCRSVHAEQNAIINAARAGVSLLGGDMYIYGVAPDSGEPIDAFPCFICKKSLYRRRLDQGLAGVGHHRRHPSVWQKRGLTGHPRRGVQAPEKNVHRGVGPSGPRLSP